MPVLIAEEGVAAIDVDTLTVTQALYLALFVRPSSMCALCVPSETGSRRGRADGGCGLTANYIAQNKKAKVGDAEDGRGGGVRTGDAHVHLGYHSANS